MLLSLLSAELCALEQMCECMRGLTTISYSLCKYRFGNGYLAADSLLSTDVISYEWTEHHLLENP